MSYTLPYTVGTDQNPYETFWPSGICIGGDQPQVRFNGRLRDFGMGHDLADRPNHRGFWMGPAYAFSITDASFDPVGNVVTSNQARFTPQSVGWTVTGLGVLDDTQIASFVDAQTVHLTRAIDTTVSDSLLRFCNAKCSVNDLVYLATHGFEPSTVGIGFPQSPGGYRLHVLTDPDTPGDGTMRLSTNKQQVGPALTVGPVRSSVDTFRVSAKGEVRAAAYQAKDGSFGYTGQINIGAVALDVRQGLIVGFKPQRG